ncbi:MAG: hypothetical protein LC792_02040, partial [Actinobacteria bacterium]|nr:hypothetical protein [Actinomycetota bacterium]
ARVAGPKTGWVADRIAGSAFDGRPVAAWSIEEPSGGEGGPGPSLLFEAAGPDDVPVDLGEARKRLLALGQNGGAVTVRMVGPFRRRFLVETGPVAGFGWTTFRRAGDGETGSEPGAIAVRTSTLPGGGAVLDNGIVRVEVDPRDGTFSLATEGGLRAAGLNRHLDGGDGGDTYSWCPPAADIVIDRPTSVTVTVDEAGPLRGRVTVTATYEWPTHAQGDEHACTGRAATTATATVRTALSLVAGDPVVAVETSVDNRCRDHRLRVHFPLPEPVPGSDAGCAFAVVHRGLVAESGPAETPPPTFPARRFVDCSAGGRGLAVIADGTFEYELCEEGRELAVTLLRATGWLSRRRLPLRPDPAGPAVPVEGAQVQGLRRWRYGVLLHAGDWETAHLHRRAGAFLTPFEAVSAVSPAGRTARPPTGQALRVDGAEVSAVRRDRHGVAVRLYHPGFRPASATVGGETVDLRPGQIRTVSPVRPPGAE